MTVDTPKKRGRRTKEEYYQTKQIDTVLSEDDLSIFLPITLNDCLHNPNIDMNIEIMSTTPGISAYSPEKTIQYSEIKKDINVLNPVSKKNIHSSEAPSEKGMVKTEIFDLTLNKEKDCSYTKSSIACWWCCHTFDSQPVHLPIALKKDIYNVIGVFCSYSCCLSYMKYDRRYSKNIFLLNYMFRDQIGRKLNVSGSITPAPPRESLNLFGGPLSITEFREKGTLYEINNYPMTYLPSHLEKTTVKKADEKFFKILPSSQKVKKPVILPNNSLGKILGINLPNHH